MVRKRTSGVTKKHKLKSHNKPTRKHKKTHNKQVRKRRTGKRRRKRGGSKRTNDKLNYDKLNYDKLKKDAIQFIQTDAKISSIIGKDLQKVIIPYIENASEKQMNEIMKNEKKLKGLQSGKKQYGGLDEENNHLCVLNVPTCNGQKDIISQKDCSNSECLRIGPSSSTANCYYPDSLRDWFAHREGSGLPATIPHLGNNFSVREMQNGLPQWCVPYDTYNEDTTRYNELAATAAVKQRQIEAADELPDDVGHRRWIRPRLPVDVGEIAVDRAERELLARGRQIPWAPDVFEREMHAAGWQLVRGPEPYGGDRLDRFLWWWQMEAHRRRWDPLIMGVVEQVDHELQQELRQDRQDSLKFILGVLGLLIMDQVRRALNL